MIGSLAKLNRILVLVLMFAWAGDACSVSGKVIRYANIGVKFDIDGEGRLQSVSALSEANKALHPQLLEKFKSYRFIPRFHEGVAVPAVLQAIVPMQAVQTKDGQVHLVFKKPAFQPVRIGGRHIDFLELEKLVFKRGTVFVVNVKISPDGTVSHTDIRTKGLKINPEAISYIKDVVATWRYAVDIEAGIPQAMSTEIRIQFGPQFNPHMAPLSRPGLN